MSNTVLVTVPMLLVVTCKQYPVVVVLSQHFYSTVVKTQSQTFYIVGATGQWLTHSKVHSKDKG